MTKKQRRPSAASSRRKKQPDVTHVDLGTSCTVHEAAALRTTCLAALEAGRPTVLDGAHVERVDTAGLQVLVGFTIDCMERALAFTWSGRSATLARGIRLLGLEPLLESPGIAAMPAGGEA